jgi:hypothetical protein
MSSRKRAQRNWSGLHGGGSGMEIWRLKKPDVTSEEDQELESEQNEEVATDCDKSFDAYISWLVAAKTNNIQ